MSNVVTFFRHQFFVAGGHHHLDLARPLRAHVPHLHLQPRHHQVSLNFNVKRLTLCWLNDNIIEMNSICD